MLEIRNVTKVYHSKAGNSVKALDNVSVTFPESGMVFILGKSGSGKSTLLNVIGGLDGCDSGEFIIKGKSSAHFAGSDFDAYRNTFIGFIFQEYNVLDDFTVGANIGLALELQGKKATGEQISNILRQVDMLDYAKRKPNELSGGQKQRVAIARALVKDPEIIMADEPTGALDSGTGKQILDTLKELSRTKLVIVVSHDREFAERYGDRIIEMQDGKILTDVTKHEVEAKPISSGILQMSDSLLRIEKGYQLTPRDVELINDYLRNQNAEILISGDKRLNENVRSAAGVSQNNSTSVFENTDSQKDVKVKAYDGKATKFIRSRLPMKNALRMGSSSLGHKKFRLTITILLSVVAFTLSGFADTLGAYQKVRAATESIVDSHVTNASFSLGVKHTWMYPDGDTHFYYDNVSMNEEDIENLSDKTGIDFIPVFNGDSYGMNSSISLNNHMVDTGKITGDGAYTGNLYGLTSVETSKLEKLGFRINGQMPQKDDEIAISELMFRQFKLTGFTNEEYKEKVEENKLTKSADGDANSIIGKHISLRLDGMRYTFKITAVIDTAFEYDRYAAYVPDENSSGGEQNGNELVDMLMRKELANTLRYGFHSLGYITQNAMDTMAQWMNQYGRYSYIGTQMNWNAGLYREDGGEGYINQIAWLDHVGTSADLTQVGTIHWLDGTPRTSLNKYEMVVSNTVLNSISMQSDFTKRIHDAMTELFGSYFDPDNVGHSLSDYIHEASFEAYVADETVFNRFRDDVATAYNAYYGYPAGDDETLRSFWRECMEWNHSYLPDGCKTREELSAEAGTKLMEKLLGGSVVLSKLSDLDSMFAYDGEKYYLAKDNLLHHLIQSYAAASVYNKTVDYESQEFFDLVLQGRYKNLDEWLELDAFTREQEAIWSYVDYIQYNSGDTNLFGKDRGEFEQESMSMYTELTGITQQDLLDEIYFAIRTWDENGEQTKKYSEYKIVGLFEASNEKQNFVISDTLYEAHEDYCAENGYGKEIVAAHKAGIYAFAIAPMPSDKDDIAKLVELSYEDDVDLRFSLQNQVMDTLDSFNEFIEMGAKIFLYIGLGFAVFAALMLMNFISVSISYKRREIGILRAVGARSSDVFKIFFCEAFIIALINYILSLSATIAVTTFFNNVVRNEGINVTLLNFGIRQIILMLLISVFVAAVASFLPVWNIARRKPVDAIKNK